MISSDAAGCLEVVRDGVTGLVVPTRNHLLLKEAMETLGNNPDLCERFGKAARAKAEGVFSIDDVVMHTFRIYEELLN
jgi:glycosyltransferase involved in cell wall biosynthesis